jgi:hypothetical protein
MKLPESISTFELSYEISTTFKSHAYIRDHFPGGFIDGWWLLGHIDSNRGQQGKLFLFDTDEHIALSDLKLCPQVSLSHFCGRRITCVRAAIDHWTKKYKNTIFIILPKGSKDIPINPEFYGFHRCDVDNEDGSSNDRKNDDDKNISDSQEPVCLLPEIRFMKTNC